MSSVIAQVAECNIRCITNKPAKQFITSKVFRGLKKHKGVPEFYCDLGLIEFKTKLLCFHF